VKLSRIDAAESGVSQEKKKVCAFASITDFGDRNLNRITQINANFDPPEKRISESDNLPRENAYNRRIKANYAIE
jgi:hypothetical protein